MPYSISMPFDPAPNFSGDRLAEAILVLGSQRSGTTWLAKILDSHPDVLYRHEPDQTTAQPKETTKAAIQRALSEWVNNREARANSQRPFFAKSWQPAPARWLRWTIAGFLSACALMPSPIRALSRLPIPDLGRTSQARILIKSIQWCDGAGPLARLFPRSRVILILRHPCGHVSSILRGVAQGRFQVRYPGDLPYDRDQAMRHAARQGVSGPEFNALPEAARYAWAWLAFNETALDDLEHLPNARVVLYEDLCTQPEAIARDLLAFAGLEWNAQTAAFISNSTTHEGKARYYAVLRNSIAAAEGWRTKMKPADQEAVRQVVCRSRLSQFWPDLACPPPLST